MRDRDGCNPDKDIIDILPGANWCGTCYRSKPTAALRYSSDIRVSPMQDRANQTGKVQGTSATKIIAESSSVHH
jgi:hypothetical protein